MPSEPLAVLIAGRHAGVIDRFRRRLRLTYDPAYAADPAASPLSLSLPLSDPVAAGPRVSGWLDGVLPGNDMVRSRWAAKHGALSDSPFDLLSTPLGLDLPGAVQTCPLNDLDDIASRPSGIDWLSTPQFEELVDELVREQRWQRSHARSAWSLAGAQSKTALVHDGDRWGEPWGNIPSTHILKPSMRDLADQAVNEHLCLAAARHCGLAVARSQALRVGDHSVIAVRRFDRTAAADGTVTRVHQEDFHQACGEPGAFIYRTENRGHPLGRLARLLADNSADPDADLRRFFDALVFNWLVCNSDAHSKNYSILLGPHEHRLAPLYDIWSLLPYEGDLSRSHTLAMPALADRRILAAENPQAWATTASTIGLPNFDGPRRAAQLSAAVGPAFTRAADELPDAMRASPIVGALTVAMNQRSRHCEIALSPSRAPAT